MTPFPEAMREYKRQLKEGNIQVAYRGLMEFMRDLRSQFGAPSPGTSVSSSIYYGTMDMTYFSINPKALSRLGLKIPVVFLHEEFRFEVWLSGRNRKVQQRFWNQLKEVDLDRYHLAGDPMIADYLIRHTLVAEPDFSDLDLLRQRIVGGTTAFIGDIAQLLSSQAS